MSGKAERISTSINRLKKHQINLKELEALQRNRNTPRPVASSAFSGSSAAGDVGGQGNFLSLDGGGLNGPLSLKPPVDFSVEIDSDNAIDIGPKDTDQQNSSNIQLEDIQPNTFTLDTIDGGVIDGQLLFVRTFAPSSTFTIAQGTLGNGGNIQTSDGTDVTGIGDLQIMVFMYDELLNIEVNTEGTWRLLNTFGTGGGGLSEPVILTVNVITPQTLPTTSVIDWSLNPNHITLDRDVEFSFDNLPPSGDYEGVLVIIDVDATGGYAAPVWPAAVTNPPTVSTTALTRTSVMLYTIDNGTTVTHATSVGSSTGGGALLSNVVIDTTKDWEAFGISNFGALTGVTSIDLDGATPLIQGVQEVRFSDDDPAKNIQSAADELSYNVPALDQHSFYADSVEIARFEESAASVYRLNMLDNQILNAQDVSFDVNATYAGSGAVPTIGFDNDVSDTFIFNSPDTATFSFQFNNTERMNLSDGNLTFADGTQVIFNPDTINPGVNIGLAVGDPSATNNGDLWYNSSTNKFRTKENSVDVDVIGDSNSITDGDSNVTVTDSVPEITFTLNASQVGEFSDIAFLPSVPIDMTASTTDPNIIGLGKLQFTENDDTLFGTQNIITTRDTDAKMLLNVGVVSDTFEFAFAGTTEWIFTNTQLTGNNLILDNTLAFNDGAADPTATGIIARNGATLGVEIDAFNIQHTTTTGTEFAELRLTKVDATPSGNDNVGTINFNLFDSPTTTTYAQVRSEIRDVTDAGRLYLSVRADNSSTLQDAIEIIGDDNVAQSFMNVNARISSDLVFGVESGSTDLEIFPAVNTIGITLDNVSYTVGSLGTIAPPHDTTGVSTTIAALDAAFGDHKGARGMIEFSSTLTEFVKQGNGNWGTVAWVFDAITS